jgi:hypothetical protein
VWTAFSSVANAKASMPDPPDGGSSEPYAVLGWVAAPPAVSHDVYLGTDYNDVNSATTASAKYLDNTVNTTYVLPGPLELDATYYWRIDERDAGGSVDKGDTWTFTTLNYVVVDDMESYNLVAPLIRDTWLDGPYNSTGATVDLGIFLFVPVHYGALSMIYDYNNTHDWGPGYYSEIRAETLDLVPDNDWTMLGERVLELWFHGMLGNAVAPADQMYLALEDDSGTMASVSYSGPAADVATPAWHLWRIELQDFGEDVNLADVRTMYIGFGIRGNTTVPGGLGVVYFDDIRLYPSRCLPGIIKPRADLNDDCLVYFQDLRIMSQEWLTTGIRADLFVDNCVNIKDLAVMIADWLDEMLWPP